MADRCPTGFDEKLITAYLDGELTQSAEQKVSVHIEDCAHCRELLADLERIREAAMTTRFEPPPDDQWDERPHGRASLTFRLLGWWLAVPWVLVVLGYALWEAWRGAQGAVERVIVFGGITALVLLLASAILDRLRDARSDRYREVRK